MPDCYQVLFVQRRKGSLGVGQIKEDFIKRGEIFKFKLKLTGNSMSIRRNDMSKSIEVLDMPYVKKTLTTMHTGRKKTHTLTHTKSHPTSLSCFIFSQHLSSDLYEFM